jgi:iron complex transport system substrate-binding protein
VPDVGAGIRPSAEAVLARTPDAVVLFAGPDNHAAIVEFERLGIPTLALYHNSLGDLERNLERLGELSGRVAAAAASTRRIRAQLARVAALTAGLERVSVYYDLWSNPPITIGAGSYLDSLIHLAGGSNIFGDLPEPSPKVSLEAIVIRDPALVLVPTAAGETRDDPLERPGWDAIPAVRDGRVRTVDAELLHRLGPRIGTAAMDLAIALHPGIVASSGASAEANTANAGAGVDSAGGQAER